MFIKNMKKQDIVTILFTLICGIVAGSYLFVVGFRPQVVQVTSELVSPPDLSKLIIIEGYQYGGCERTGQCASFRIQDDGEYSYVATSIPTTEGRFGGVIPRRDWQAIRNRLSAPVLAQGATRVSPGDCASFVDAIDVRYEITFQGERYMLDTCQTSLSEADELKKLLDGLWQFIRADISRL